jgi:hypothetical protein|tara:strand:+ start:200 stop:352 length:153 start_codon:yes stop_codon:yes gene_type:complete
MNDLDITRNTYKTNSISKPVTGFESLSADKKTKIRTIVSNFFSYIKDKHS